MVPRSETRGRVTRGARLIRFRPRQLLSSLCPACTLLGEPNLVQKHSFVGDISYAATTRSSLGTSNPRGSCAFSPLFYRVQGGRFPCLVRQASGGESHCGLQLLWASA